MQGLSIISLTTVRTKKMQKCLTLQMCYQQNLTNDTHMKRYFVDYGDYNRTQNASEIFIRYEQDGELFDVCQMSDECGDPVSIAEYMCSCLSVPQMG